MHILIVASDFPNPSDPLEGVFERDQARALQDAGHTVTYAAIDLRSARHRRRLGLRHFVEDGLNVYLYSLPVSPLRAAYEPVGGACFRAILRRVCAERGAPDIVHAHFLGVAAIAAPVCREKNLPLVITEHTSALNAPDPGKALVKTMRKTYPLADALLVVSSLLAGSIYRHTGAKAVVVPNIIDTQSFSVVKEDNVPGEPFRFVASGFLIERKGYDLLLRAAGDLRRRGYALALTVFGDGPEREALEKLAESEGVRDCVDFRGQCTRGELGEAYPQMDAFVLASRRETFGVVYIEAMAAGLPVIATRCGGPEDFVTEENGILIPVDDAAALTDAMEHMMLHRREYDSASISADIRRKFAPETIAARLTDIYKTVLEKN